MNEKKSENPIIKNKNLQILFGVTLISIMGVASLTPAFPGVGAHFNKSADEVALLITFFTFPGVILTPILGVLADRFGRKLILAPSLFLFGAAGVSCFFAKDFELLLGLRLLQGVGAGALGSINVTIIGDLFSGRERSAAMGLNASVLSVGTASYPIVGGALATIGWQYPFLLPALGFVVGSFVLFALKNPEPKDKQKLSAYFSDAFKIASQRSVLGIFIIGILVFIILYGPYLSYFPFLIGETFGQPPYIIGIIMASASIASMITAGRIGALTKRFSERNLMITSAFFYAGSMLIVPFLDSAWLLIIASLLFGIAQGLNLPCALSLLTSLAPMKQRAAIMSLNGTVLRLGQTLGPVVIFPVYVAYGADGTFYFGAAIAALILITILTMVTEKS